MDPKRPKIKSSQIKTKSTPLSSARCADFYSILFFKNGLYMAKLSRSQVFPKQEKKVKVKVNSSYC
jgi:hypothetical protein